jgi:hypothetical protein
MLTRPGASGMRAVVHKAVPPVTCLVLGLAGGVLIGQGGKGPPSPAVLSAKAAAPNGAMRETRNSERLIPANANLEDLMELMKTGRSGVAEARLTLALDDVPPEKLSELADELREHFRKNPSYDFKQMRLLGGVMSAWTASDPRAALAFVKDSPSKTFRNLAHDSIFSVLAEEDPADALARAKELGTSAERLNALAAAAWATGRKDPREAIRLFGGLKEIPDHVRTSLINELGKISPEEAVAELAKISPNQRDRFWNSEGVFTTWASSDPEALLAWATTATDLNMRGSAYRAYCRRIASDDPAGALQKVGTMPAHLRTELIGAVMESWADTDLPGALAAAQGIAQPAERERAMQSLGNRLDWMDATAASKVVLAMPKGNARTSALEDIAWGLRWQSPAERNEILAQFEGVEYSRLAGKVAATMVAEDPQAAIKLFNEVPPTLRGEYDFRYFMNSLSQHDPKLALEFATSLESASDRSQAVRQAFEQMAALSPQEAARTMEAMDNPKDRQQALVALAEAWSQRDPDAALRWAESLSGEEQTAALAKLLPEQARNDPASAAARLKSLLSNPGSNTGAVMQSATGELAREWAGRSPLDAAAWVAGLPPGSAAESGAGALVENWSSHNPSAAADWISDLPDGGVKDAAIQPLVESIRQNDPETAFSWGLSIQDAAKRAAVMEATIRNWNTNDADAVRIAIQSADLDPTEKANYEKILH